MKFWNKTNTYVPVSARESVPPYGVTREFAAEEAEKNDEIRDKLARGILIPWDGKSPLPSKAQNPAGPQAHPTKPLYTIAPDSIGGANKTIQPGAGQKAVEYVVADTEGSDDVQNAVQDPEIMAALPEEGRPTDYIEEGVSGREMVNGKAELKTQWKSATEAFEAELNQETTQDVSEFDDSGVLAEGEDTERQDALDADHAIDENYTHVLQANGSMGATETTTAQIVSDATVKATAALAAAVQPNVDDGELVAGASAPVADFLKKPFFEKKWIVAKSTEESFLKAVAAVTKSEALKSIIEQRLAELETK